jgi:RNA recognition motif-containing protein
MSFTVFLGNLPAWVTADDIQSWLSADNLVADQIKVIRNPETQESKGFAFIEAPNQDEMQAIIKRLDRAPLEERLLRANPAQPPRSRRSGPPPQPGSPAQAGTGMGHGQQMGSPSHGGQGHAGPGGQQPHGQGDRRRDRRGRSGGEGGERRRGGKSGPQSAFAEELAKAL